MNIRPRNIPKFQNGSTFNLEDWIKNNLNYYNWYQTIYPNAPTLQGNPLKQRNDLWNKNLLSSSHYTTDDLKRSAYNNYLYTNDYLARQEDLIRWGESLKDFGTISDQDFVNRYNTQALKIRDAREAPQTYNKPGYTDSNQTFRGMFYNRSKQGTNVPLYTIGYQDNIEDIEGTSTWQRRMDRYEKPFELDSLENLKNRVFTITKPNGSKIKVYKKENGNIGLFSELPENILNQLNQGNLETPTNQNNPDGTRVPIGHKEKYGPDWSKINGFLGKVVNNPNLWAAGRLAGNLINNTRVYDEALKGIQPDLLNPYHTHRQVVGDEATKLSYYRQATAGETRAARPFTSDADRQVAYMNEAKRIGDELRAKGDLVDNAEIRRTSDESNQHQWANTQRDTEVANANRASINKANADRHRLLALKHSAQWSSIDNFLKEQEYRKRQKIAEEQAFDDEIFALDLKEALIGDPRLIVAKKKVNDALEKAKDNIYDPEVLKASNEYKRLSIEIAKEQAIKRKNYYKNRGLISFAKSGTKIVHKKKDDLLYKSAKDVVEHFRKMSKIVSDDARKNKPVKIQKLASHPKGNTRKYLLGGLAPFTVYTPVALGGETSRTTTSETSSSRASSKASDNAKNTLDLVKDLFKTLSGAGLPSDINVAYSSIKGLFDKAKLFGEELDTDDIAGIYLSAMNLINNVKYQKAEYDKALTIVNNKNAGQEVAIGANGIIVLNRETGKIEEKSLSELKNLEGYSVLTNNDLLHLRAMDTSKAFNIGMMLITTNATSMEEIGKFLKANLLSNIGSTEQEYSGLTKAQTAQVKAGLASLMNDNQTGDVKSKTQQALEELALRYLKGILPLNMKTLLDFNSLRSGISQEDLLKSLVYSGDTSSLSYSLHNIKEGKSGSGSGSSGGSSDNSAGLAFAMGLGPREVLYLNPNTSLAIKVLGIKGTLQTHSNENLGQGATLQDATKSLLGGYLLWNKATFGGSRLNSGAFSHIILNDSTIMGMDLPITTDINGNEVPDFLMLKKVEQVEEIIDEKKITDYREINKLYLEYSLPPKYTANGKLNTMKYKRFAAILATLDELSLQNSDAILSDEITMANDAERDLYVEAMKSNTNTKDYDLSDGMFGLWKDKLYKGTIFVPYSEDIAFAAVSSGKPFDQGLPNNVAEIQMKQYAPKAASYKNPNMNFSQISQQ